MLRIIVVLWCGLLLFSCGKNTTSERSNGASYSRSSNEGDRALKRAFDQKLRGFQIKGSGTVKKVLPDDNKGSRHQRFIIRLNSGLSILVAHNIDLAKRVHGIASGQKIEFYGVYEYNSKGGVIHWTHHDPAGRHVDGWLKHNGVVYK